MTEEILFHARELFDDIRELKDLANSLNADDLEISIEASKCRFRREWECDSVLGGIFRKAMIEVIEKKLEELVAEFNAL